MDAHTFDREMATVIYPYLLFVMPRLKFSDIKEPNIKFNTYRAPQQKIFSTQVSTLPILADPHFDQMVSFEKCFIFSEKERVERINFLQRETLSFAFLNIGYCSLGCVQCAGRRVFEM